VADKKRFFLAFKILFSWRVNEKMILKYFADKKETLSFTRQIRNILKKSQHGTMHIRPYSLNASYGAYAKP